MEFFKIVITENVHLYPGLKHHAEIMTHLLNVQVSGGGQAAVCDHQLPLRDGRQGDVLHGRGGLEGFV